MPSIAAYTLCILHDPASDRVLLIDRAMDRVQLPGLLNGLGGKFKSGEDWTAAARREVREEAGVIALDLTFRGTESWVCEHIDGSLKDQGTLYLFTATRWMGVVAERCSEGELVWLSRDEALGHPRLAPNLTTILPAMLDAPGCRYCGMAHYVANEDGAYELTGHEWVGW